MEKLVIETTAVESSSSTFTSISGQVDSLHGSVSGYDTSTSVSTSAPVSFDVDVSSLKDKIATNMQICAKRIKNISLAVEEVAKTHSSLQVSLETKAPHYLTESEDETGDSTSTTAGTYAASAGAGAAGAGAGAGSGSGSGSTTKKASDTKKDKKGPVETELTDVGYVYADTANLTKESLDLFSNANFEYDANGYAKIGDRYVVACDYTIGNIGDVIRFTQTTGEIIECVIGINTFSKRGICSCYSY